MTHHYEGLLGNRQLGVGAVDVQDPKVESGETVAERIRAHTLARARADHRDQLVRLQSSAAAGRLRQAEGDGRGEAHARRVSMSNGREPLRSARSESDELLALAAGGRPPRHLRVAGAGRHGAALAEVPGALRPDRVRRPLRELARLHLPRGPAPRRATSSRRAFAEQAREFAGRVPHRRARATARCAGSRRAPSSSTTPTGAPVRVVGVNVDVTERKRALVAAARLHRDAGRGASGSARASWKPRTRRAGRPRSRCGRRRRWRPSASSPAASRTTSTICSPSCSAGST